MWGIAGKIKGRDVTRLAAGISVPANVATGARCSHGAGVFVGDVLKGFLAVYIGRWLGGTPAAAVLAVWLPLVGTIGRCFWDLEVEKGVATSFGACLALSPLLALSLIAVWIVAVAITRYSSLGSILGAGAAPFMAAILRQGWPVFWFGVAGAL